MKWLAVILRWISVWIQGMATAAAKRKADALEKQQLKDKAVEDLYNPPGPSA